MSHLVEATAEHIRHERVDRVAPDVDGGQSHAITTLESLRGQGVLL
jgi:hypothetical protein